MRSKIITLLLVAAVFLPVLLMAGTTGKIAGVVRDKNSGEGLIGVNIIVEGTSLGGTTDLDGSFIILNIPPGEYTLVFQYIGYREVRLQNVKVSVDFTTRLDVSMQEATIELGETVEVVAEREVVRRDLTSSQVEVTSSDIAAMPSEEFEQVLQTKAGVTRDAGGGFHIRGGRSSEVAFWVDGISVTDGFDGSNAVEVENSAIQSLQVISGTFNAEYGQAMSGIINIVTKEGGEKYSGNISAYTGDYFSSDDDIFYNIDDISPSHLYDFKASLEGPVPFSGKKMRFFTNFRHNYNDGWLYGRREYVPNGDTTLVGERLEGTPGDSSVAPMNYNRWWTGLLNLSYQLTPVMKIRLKGSYEYRNFKEYDHFWKLNPDGDFKKFQWGYNTSLTFDHALSSRTFYTVQLSRFEKEFEQYVYEDPTDPRYVDAAKFAVPAFNFSRGGQKNQHFNRNTQTTIGKFDITSQVTDNHLMKAGIEFRQHRLYFLDYNVIDAIQTDTIFTAIRPMKGDPNYNEYTYKPYEFSAYIQDKMEYQDFIVNIGLRFDYFYSNGRVLADPKDPNIYSPLREQYKNMTLAEREKVWYKDPDPKLQISPRIGVAYPISSQGVIHFSYGHFLQIPEFRLLYENPEFRVTREAGNNNKIGNADLDAQRTVMYEIGLQQQLSSDLSVDVTGFYRDIRGWVGTSPLMETYAVDIKYSQYENRDYANVRGVTLAFRKKFSQHWSANLDYTFQVAEGNASDPDDAFNDAKANKQPRRVMIPLNWDRTHVLSGNLFFGFGNYSASLLGRFESGLPYTPNPVQGTRVGANVETGLKENSERRPNLLTFDLQLYRDFLLKMAERDLRFSLFVKIYNLFDRRNEQIVYDDTGRATYTLQGIVAGAGVDPEYLIQPHFYTEPRRVQVGFSFNF
ncbi:MAG: TonB-dependent receptor [Calditrichia bacterium]